MRRTTVLAGIALLVLGSAAIWWYGPWNAEVRYGRMPLLALHRLADDQPRNKAAWHVLSLRLARDGDAALAEPALRQAFDINPDDGVVATRLAQVLLATGRPGDAFQILKQTAGRKPADVPVRLELGRLYEQGGAFDRAATEYEAAAAVDSTHGEIWYSLAQCYFKMQKLAPSQNAIGRALNLQPNEPHFLMFSAGLHVALGRGEEAIAAAKRAASLAPNDLDIQGNYTAMLLARRHSPQDLQEVETTVARMEQVDPKYPPLSSLRGDIEAQRGNWDAAARYYQKAADALPDSDHVYFVLAQAYRHLNRAVEAANYERIYTRRQAARKRIITLQAAIGAQSQNADLFEQLSSAELDIGHRAEAIDALERALVVSPGADRIRKKLAKLRRTPSSPLHLP